MLIIFLLMQLQLILESVFYSSKIILFKTQMKIYEKTQMKIPKFFFVNKLFWCLKKIKTSNDPKITLLYCQFEISSMHEYIKIVKT